MDNFTFDIPEIFYDLIGIFIPGFFLFLGISVILPRENYNDFISESFLNSTIVTLFLIYLSGHAIYSLSTVIIARVFRKLSGNPKFTLLGKSLTKRQQNFNKYFLMEEIDHDKYFSETVERGVKLHTDITDFDIKKSENMDIAYEHCRNFIMENAKKNYAIVRKEQAYGEMSRGIILVCFICLFLLIVLKIFTDDISSFVSKLLFFVLCIVCFSYRYGQARHVDPIFVYSTFCTFIKKGFEKSK
jgi:hypothetical protein